MFKRYKTRWKGVCFECRSRNKSEWTLTKEDKISGVGWRWRNSKTVQPTSHYISSPHRILWRSGSLVWPKPRNTNLHSFGWSKPSSQNVRDKVHNRASPSTSATDQDPDPRQAYRSPSVDFLSIYSYYCRHRITFQTLFSDDEAFCFYWPELVDRIGRVDLKWLELQK